MRAEEITDIITEHSDWPEDTRVTERDMLRLHDVANAAAQIASSKGIELTFSKHFFDQMKLLRGITVITPDALISILGKIINRGLNFFRGKETRTTYVFQDESMMMYIVVTMMDDNRFKAITTIRDTKWNAPGQVVKL